MRLLIAAVAIVAASLAIQCDSDSGCVDDFDCPDAQVCKVSTSACEDLVCKVDADCDGDTRCSDNECL